MTKLIDLEKVNHHPMIEQMVDVLCNKTDNIDRGFFRVEVAYFLAKMASSMRATINTKDRGQVPVNIYALALATSGFGKGHSVNIIEDQFLKGFKTRFLEETFPTLADDNLWKLAIARAVVNSTEEEDEKARLDKEFAYSGQIAFTFDSGTAPAVKQLRHKLLLANAGSINLQIDEIGSNLVGNVEVLNVFLELYDQGLVKQKLTKNTSENVRGQEIDGKTPTNALLFGTPSKLLDGGQTEDQFYSFLDTGYARRCIFGWGYQKRTSDTLTPAEVYERLTKPQNTTIISQISDHLTTLADPSKYQWQMEVQDDVGIALVSYKMYCEDQAATYAEHEDIRKAEMSHRYFKALKLSGALAFVDESPDITIDHLNAAIKLVEESGQSFQQLMTREKTYVKLAKFIASSNDELTHADLHEALPFYKSSQTARNELMTLATAWGYRQHIVIKKNFVDGIEFFSGTTLEETDIDQIQVAYSNHFAYEYGVERVPFTDLHQLTQADGMHFTNHAFKNNHRSDENAIPGFNMIAIDADGSIPIETAHQLLSDYTFMTYTTKRHSDSQNRFRLLMPIDYFLELDKADYKAFMNNIMEWLPFETDESANQPGKKWETFNGSYHYNSGNLLQCLPFVPKTSKNQQHNETMRNLDSLDNLERWFAQRIASGNRNNQMIKFAFALVDSGMDYNSVESCVTSFNAKLPNSLSNEELQNTIFQSIAKKYS